MSIDGGLRAWLSSRIKGPHWQAIETGGTGKGIPDLYGCWEGSSVWIECKKTTGWAVNIEPEQVAWLLRHSRSGGRCYLAVRRQTEAGPRRGAAVDEFWLFHGSEVMDVADRGLRCGIEPRLKLEAPWDYREIAHVLFDNVAQHLWPR